MSKISLRKCCEIGKRVLREAWQGEPADEYEASQLGARVTDIVVDVLARDDRWIDEAAKRTYPAPRRKGEDDG